MNKEDLEELKGILLNHCYNMSILKKNAFEKKKESILDSLLISVIRANLSIEDIKECIKEVNENKIVNVEFFDNGGNLFKDYIKPKWVTFAKELFRQRSGGLGTPNSASGEGELMFLFLSNKIKKPTKGDLLINGEIVELKGEKDIRVFAEIRGNDFRKKTLEICKKFNLNPNKAKISKKEIYAVEIEKPQHLIYWEKE